MLIISEVQELLLENHQARMLSRRGDDGQPFRPGRRPTEREKAARRQDPDWASRGSEPKIN